jgi:hypothetical protein
LSKSLTRKRVGVDKKEIDENEDEIYDAKVF